jgi:hypothetical protein
MLRRCPGSSSWSESASCGPGDCGGGSGLAAVAIVVLLPADVLLRTVATDGGTTSLQPKANANQLGMLRYH